jgi:hypothetical protein
MRIVRLILCVTALLAVPCGLFAQAGATGSILGTVTDATGAVIPGAKVTVTNTGTGVPFHTVSSSAGDFLAPGLQPGTYSVTAEAKGFQKSVTTGFSLSVDQKIRVNVTLQAGAVTSTVTVSAQAVALDTDSEALSQLVSQRQVEQLPLNGRNFMQLLLVTPGAVTVGGEQGTMRQGEGDAMSINGGRPEGNNYTLDGLDNTDPALVTPAVILSQDAIQEFKVQGGDYSAEYGYSASQINIVSKGGTNELHGSIFEDNRNNAYDAKPFPVATDYIAGVATALPVLRQNQFGFVVDGPVYIPKIYNGHNKTFFMANYEGWRINNGGRLTESVPNPAVLQGNFSGETYPANTIKRSDGSYLPGGTLPLYGTADCDALLANNYNCMPIDPTTGQAFPNDTILPGQMTNRLANVAISNNYWAKPTVANQPEGVNNFIQNYAAPLTTNQQTYRIDQHLGKLGSVFFRFTKADYTNHSLYNSGNLTYGIEEYIENQKSWTVSHTMSIGNHMVNNFRFGYLDANAPQGAPAPTAAAISALAETGVFTHFTALQQTWPNVGLTNYASGGGPVNAYTGSDSPAWEFADSFTLVHGRHTFGLGFDYRTWQLARNLDDDFYGDWGFTSPNIQTNNANCPNPVIQIGDEAKAISHCGTGNAVADMMLGYYHNVGGFVPGPLSPTTTAGNPQTHQFGYFGPYFYDDWKMTPKLTMNLGIRWDYRAAAYEIHNHFFWLDTKNPEGGLCYADPVLSTDGVAPGVGVNGGPILRYCGSVPHPGQKTPFAPRFGLAYRLNDKTVLRGGFGIFFDSYEGREIDDSADIYPYSIRNSLVPSNDSTLPKFGNQMFPAYSTLGPFPESTLSFIAVIESENPIDPYVQSWNVSGERQLTNNTTLEVNYIGSHAVHLLDRHDIAQPNSISAADLPFCQADPTDKSHNCPVSTRLPYPNFTGFYIDSDFHGYSHYNAVNFKLQRSAANLAATVIYTYANSKDDKSAAAGVGATGSGYQGFMNNHDPNLDYGPSDFDVPQRFVASYIYNLPFGRGQRFLGSANRAANLAVGGWQVTGIATFQSGFPLSISATDTDSLLGTTFQRANYTPGCDITGNLTQRLQRINMSCFNQPAIGEYGNTKRNFLRQPGINNWDMGFGKSFDIAERLKFQLNVDTFNTFNHHQYDNGVGGLVTGGSGGGSAISNSVSSSTPGQITGRDASRIIQLAGKITF